jgi:regulator of protease activity HflC (stomatin/prohibitin superfamily)
VSDDLARAVPAIDPATLEAVAGSRPWVQLTESSASPADAGDVLETADDYGRVPVVVRIRRVPPIRVEALLLAALLVASGIFVPIPIELRGILILGAVLAVVVGLANRIVIRVPAGSVGLVIRGGTYRATLNNGVHRVSPNVLLSHVVTTREVGFDVPVTEVLSSDGVGVVVDVLLTLGIEDHAKLVYNITMGDLDQLLHAASRDAVRGLVRVTAALEALDYGDEAAERLRTTIDAKLAAYGVVCRAVTFTRIQLPGPIAASLEARRLAAVQLAEEQESHTLNLKRLADRATLVAQEQESRQRAVELEAAAEAKRLASLEQRLKSYPKAAAYDLETGRLRVAQQLAGNSRAVVNVGGGDLVSGLLSVHEAERNDRDHDKD